ncbi:autotransporter-associated beta strand repeat-containing protein [Luteolibacter ambystomatis]|uniref:Autotransporter-associated beta strand repeat-containing protein n=1 Tax=Luteolibacter ambystomatis TaxID=2824561 RepID=A0A975PGA2_9BACT|nr:autotransporter-associated beta strand repeat-containing protein [Luteolibacter ambystomatis]QUE52122.1 autotransporter-associated beta strand repeat-containing protein [Luteolibacter ambystomatis]
MKPKFNHSFCLRLAAISLSFSCITHGANLWDGGGADGNWNTPANWDNDTVPTSPAALTFDGGVQLTNNNNLTGFTANGLTFNVGAGSFVIGGNAISLGGDIVNNSAALQTINAGLTLTTARTVNAASGNVTLGGPVTGTFSLAKTGTGKLTLSGTGGTSQLAVGNSAAGGTAEISGGAWTQVGTITSVGLIVGTGNGASGALTISGGTHTFGGDAYANAVRIGVAQGAAQTPTGSITVSGGTVKIGTTGALDASVNLGTAMNTGTSNGALVISGGSVEVGRRVLVAANSTTNTAVLTLSGSGTLNMVRTGSNAEGDLGMVRLGAGGSTINFDGGTYIATGLHTSTATNTSTINFNGTEIRANASGGNFGNGGTANFRVQAGGLIFNSNGFDSTIANPLINSLTTTGNLTKNGAGTLTLTGASTFTGALNVNAGTLALTTGTVPATTAVNVAAAAKFTTNNSTTRTFGAVTLGNGTTWAGLNAVPVGSPQATVTGALAFGTSATIGISSWGGVSTIGTVQDVIQAGSITGSPVLTADFGISRVTGTAAINGNKVQVTLTGSGANLIWNNAAANNTWDLNTSANFLNGAANDVFKTLDSVTFDDSSGAGAKTITLSGTLQPAALTVNNSNGDYTFSGGAISGGASLLKSGSSILTLTSGNSYAGGTTINGGMLVNNVSAALGTGNVTLNNAGSTLKFNAHDTFGQAASNPTVVVTANSGSIVTNGNTFTTFGTLNLNSSTLTSNGGANGNYQAFKLRNTVNVTGSSVIDVSASPGNANTAVHLGADTNGSQTTFNVIGASDTLTVSAVLRNGVTGGSGTVVTAGLIKAGAGKLTLSATNTYGGDTTVNAGTLSLGTASLADTADVRIASGATLDLTHAATDTIDELYIDGVQQVTGTWGGLASSAVHRTARITGTGILQITTGPAPLTYATWASTRGLTAGVNDGIANDPDGDGKNNLIEFAFDGQPLSGVAATNIIAKVGVVGGEHLLTISLPVRDGTLFGNLGGGELVSNAVDGVIYHIQGTIDLVDWTMIGVQEVTGPDAGALQAALPTPAPGWTNRSFCVPGSDPTQGNPKAFIRAKVESP